MNGANKSPDLVISYGDLNNIYGKLSEVQIRDEYVQLDYDHHQLVRYLEALRLYLLDHNINPQFEVKLYE